MAQTGSPARQRGLILTISSLALAAAIVSAVLVVVDQRVAAFVAALCSASALILSGVKVAEREDARLRFADSFAERAVDAVILGTVSWVALPEDPGVAVAALSALATSYLASYLRARAVGLGFRVDESLLLRPARMIFVALGILETSALVALWLATAVSLQAIIVRAAAVARQKESP